jgi:hypothetical protein
VLLRVLFTGIFKAIGSLPIKKGNYRRINTFSISRYKYQIIVFADFFSLLFYVFFASLQQLVRQLQGNMWFSAIIQVKLLAFKKNAL